MALTGHPVQPARVPRHRGRRIGHGNNHRPSLPHHPTGRTPSERTAPPCHGTGIKAEHAIAAPGVFHGLREDASGGAG